MNLKEYLKTKREGKNLSMNRLAELSGVSVMYISRLESGERGKPSPEIIKKLAKGLKEPYEDLLVVAGYLDPDEYVRMKNERDDIEWSLAEQEQESYYLDFLLDSNHPLYFQDRLLTKEEKAKIKSVIEIVLKD